MKYDIKKLANELAIKCNTTADYDDALRIFVKIIDDEYGDDEYGGTKKESYAEIFDCVKNLLSKLGEEFYNKNTYKFLGHEVSELIMDSGFFLLKKSINK